MMKTVWIVNQVGHDYSKAERFGELKPLTMGTVGLRVDRLVWHLSRGIGKFASEDDYLLIAGTPLVNALALAVWLTRFKEAHLLIWNAKAQDYEIARVSREALAYTMEANLR